MIRFPSIGLSRLLVPGARAMRSLAAIMVAGVLSSACDVHGVSEPGDLSSILVSPHPQTLVINGTQQFTAVGRDFSGALVTIAPVWTVVSGGGAISSNGMFTAGSTPGTFTTTVKATLDGVSSSATVIVVAGPLASITIAPHPITLGIGGAQQYTTIGRDAAGNIVPLAPTWSVIAGGGSITGSGMFTAGTTVGTFANTVQASSAGITATATVTVTPGPLATITVTPNPMTLGAGTAGQFTAVGRDANGNLIAITPTWSVVAGGGTISTLGMFTAGTVPGTFSNTVRAASGAISGTATVVVTAGPLASITVTPTPMSLSIGASGQFTAVGRDASGNIIPLTPVWSTVAGGGSVNSTGMFTAGTTPGTFTNTVRATSGDIAGSASVIVTAGALATITVTPNPASMDIGLAEQFTAVGRDASGNVVAITPTWSVVAGGGTIGASTGTWTAGNAPGTYTNTVRASIGNLAGFATVVVTPGPLASITVTPNPVTVASNGGQQFIAVGRDAGGNAFLITPAWSVVNGGGTIDPSTGLFTAGTTGGTFNGTVRATSGTVSGFATVTVTVVQQVATITVTPDPISMLINGRQQFTAIGRDGSGRIVPFSPVWSIVNGGGTINALTGDFIAGNVTGTFNNTVRASSGVFYGTATVSVTSSVPLPPVVNLGGAAANGIMAGTAVSCVSGGIINANISISAGNTLGLGSCVMTGVSHLNDGVAIQDQIDLANAYNTLRDLPCPPANAIVANLGGTTKLPGVYCTASSIGVSGTLTLDGNGNPNAVFVFQAGTSLVTAGDIVLINGAQARNVYWQVGSSATLGTASQWQGNILALTSISLIDNATLLGRALARNGAVSLTINNIITLP